MGVGHYGALAGTSPAASPLITGPRPRAAQGHRREQGPLPRTRPKDSGWTGRGGAGLACRVEISEGRLHRHHCDETRYKFDPCSAFNHHCPSYYRLCTGGSVLCGRGACGEACEAVFAMAFLLRTSDYKANLAISMLRSRAFSNGAVVERGGHTSLTCTTCCAGRCGAGLR